MCGLQEKVVQAHTRLYQMVTACFCLHSEGVKLETTRREKGMLGSLVRKQKQDAVYRKQDLIAATKLLFAMIVTVFR